MEEKWLYCPQCKKWPDKITEVYAPVEFQRKWGGETYDIVDENWPQEPESLCGDCGAKLTVR
jgi:hypothetical protein